MRVNVRNMLQIDELVLRVPAAAGKQSSGLDLAQQVARRLSECKFKHDRRIDNMELRIPAQPEASMTQIADSVAGAIHKVVS